MGDEVHIWSAGTDDLLIPLPQGRLDLEARLQRWLEADISVLDPGLLVIGREVKTDFGHFIDLLCLDSEGDLVIVELKKDKTPREVTAQGLDYASWAENLSHERVTSIADEHFRATRGTDLESEFRSKFGADLPELLNGDHRIVIVASELDAGSERIVRYLAQRSVNINAARFQYFKPPDGPELLARVLLIDSSEEELNKVASGSKRRPNPSLEDLSRLAAERGVGNIYERAIAGLTEAFQAAPQVGGLTLSTVLNGKRSAILNLFPKDSSPEQGLRYRVYSRRIALLAGLTPDEVRALLPPQPEDWIAERNNPDTEYVGYQGYLATTADVDRLLTALLARREG